MPFPKSLLVFFQTVALLLTTQIAGCSVLQAVGIGTKAGEREAQLSEQPFTVTLTISALDDINNDPDGRPSPVKVKIFLGESSVDFDSIEFDDFFGLDTSTLQPAPLKTLTLRPGNTETITLRAMKSQNQLAVAAAFRRREQTRWLQTKTVEPIDNSEINATITSVAVAID